MANNDIPVGIDLGTTFSAVAYLDQDGRPCTIPNSEGELTTPSVVFFDHDAVIVGSEAVYAGESEMGRLARAAKRDMGGVRYRKTVLNRFLPPEVIQSFVLKRLKADAELKLGPFSKAVITVPAYFNEPRRKATQDAGELAGIHVIDIINEPTAAALAYGIQRGFLNERGAAAQRELILVYDLGGGTFDVTLMEIDQTNFRAIATAGDVYLGGIDWDQRIYDFARQEIQSANDVNFDDDPILQEKLLSQCVRAKKSLTARSETVIRLEQNGKRFNVSINREQFAELTCDLLERTRLTTERLLREANCGWGDLTKLLLVGGSTRMPMVAEMLEKESDLTIDRSLSPDESVAHGAAIYAGILLKHGAGAGQGISVTNVSSHDLGVMGVDPTTRQPRRKIVIPKNCPLPAKSIKKFQVSKDGQQKIVVQVVEGGTEEGLGATTIGKCVVTDLPPDIKRGTEVRVGFHYLMSGRLDVVAEIPASGVRANSVIDRASGMAAEDLALWKTKLATGIDFLEFEPEIKSTPADSTPAKKPPHKKIVADPFVDRSAQKVTQEAVAERPARTPSRASKPQQKSSPPDSAPSPATPEPVKAASEPRETAGVDFEVDEHSGIFAFGDEDVKPEVGASALGVLAGLQENEGTQVVEPSNLKIHIDQGEEKNKPTAGDSVLDFLNQATDPQPSASDSALDDFLSQLDD